MDEDNLINTKTDQSYDLDISFIIDTSRSMNCEEIRIIRSALHLFREKDQYKANNSRLALFRVSNWRQIDKDTVVPPGIDFDCESKPSVLTKRYEDHDSEASNGAQAEPVIGQPIFVSNPDDTKKLVSSLRPRSAYYNKKSDVQSLKKPEWREQLNSKNKKISLRAKREKYKLQLHARRGQSGLALDGECLIQALTEVTKLNFRENSINSCILVIGGCFEGLIKDDSCYEKLSMICARLNQLKVILNVVHMNYLEDNEKLRLSSLTLKTGGRCLIYHSRCNNQHIAKIFSRLVQDSILLSNFRGYIVDSLYKAIKDGKKHDNLVGFLSRELQKCLPNKPNAAAVPSSGFECTVPKPPEQIHADLKDVVDEYKTLVDSNLSVNILPLDTAEIALSLNPSGLDRTFLFRKRSYPVLDVPESMETGSIQPWPIKVNTSPMPTISTDDLSTRLIHMVLNDYAGPPPNAPPADLHLVIAENFGHPLLSEDLPTESNEEAMDCSEKYPVQCSDGHTARIDLALLNDQQENLRVIWTDPYKGFTVKMQNEEDGIIFKLDKSFYRDGD